MSAPITIEALDESTAGWIAEEAKRRGVTIEELIIQLIEKAVSEERSSEQLHAYHDLDSLAGTWTDEQASEFLDAVADFESVDEKLWE